METSDQLTTCTQSLFTKGNKVEKEPIRLKINNTDIGKSHISWHATRLAINPKNAGKKSKNKSH